ncbi:hypothetical protein PVW46_16960 [Mameliella sp. AT18]|uniref:hypothetical protein n=1 Tax=Mameliella sp. AT18 TaxID=3028385 RepID=UPI0008410C3F|nr:hypothetical protein [Mameliella sp. AT18]MDD9731596.1 hypothetical protein [Mameliella sp. AT18]ODM45331.1 hypothetical protein A9320_27870 [Ruegeria sp. PBVC088]
MDAAEQKDGEARVKRVLVDGLKRLGLAKPSSLTKAEFDDMVEDLCERLAYMSEPSLEALAEQVAAHPGGKGKDRFPIAKVILDWAAEIQPPEDSASPLVRAVFAHALGQNAIAEGWAPELLASVKRTRRWPAAYACKMLRDEAEEPIRHLRDLERRLSRGDDLPPDQVAWRQRRLAVVERCRGIAAMGAGVSA